MSEKVKVVLGVDPGSSKCGLALVERSEAGKQRLRWHSIASVEELVTQIGEADRQLNFSLFVVGSGTNSRNIVELLKEKYPSKGLILVDEENTTMAARERYWEHYRRKGWRRLLPATLQVPPVPVDDFSAMILAERFLSGE